MATHREGSHGKVHLSTRKSNDVEDTKVNPWGLLTDIVAAVYCHFISNHPQ